MFITTAGLPAGYGYFATPSVANENICPALVAHMKQYDVNCTPLIMGTVSIQVDADCSISINGRAPVYTKAEVGFSFDARGVSSIAFLEAGINYNIAISY